MKIDLFRSAVLRSAVLGLALCAAVPFATAAAQPSHGQGKLSLGLHAPLGNGHVSLNYSKGPRARRWVPAHWETREQRVWVPGSCEKVWVEPRYRFAYDSCGRRIEIQIGGGHWREVQHPGHYEVRAVKVWVEAGWQDCDDGSWGSVRYEKGPQYGKHAKHGKGWKGHDRDDDWDD
jgi:hypothetical protein